MHRHGCGWVNCYSLAIRSSLSVSLVKACTLVCGCAHLFREIRFILEASAIRDTGLGRTELENFVMKKVTFLVIVVSLLLVIGETYAGKPGGKPPKDDGGGKGGFGELGNGCVTFIPGPDGFFGSINDDSIDSTYCNGTDGQVSIPVRLRVDTKKFNKEGRYYGFDYDECSPSESWCNEGAELARGQMGDEYVWIDDPGAPGTDILVRGDGLDMTLMKPTDITRVGMGFFIDNDHGLSFSNEYNDRGCFDGDAEPLWVRCDGDVGPLDTAGVPDGLCDLWTVSTYPLSPNGGFVEDPSVAPQTNPLTYLPSVKACLKDGIFIILDESVKADFTLEVCVLGTGACQ
jgi:hypothetical protein